MMAVESSSLRLSHIIRVKNKYKSNTTTNAQTTKIMRKQTGKSEKRNKTIERINN